MLRKLYRLLSLALLVPLSLFGDSSRNLENLQVETIVVNAKNLPPNASLDTESIANRLKTSTGIPFSQNDFDNDLKTLISDYDQVEPSFRVVDKKLQIIIDIYPKPNIRSISYVGNHIIKRARLQKELGIKNNTVFDREKFNQAFHKLQNLYVKKGFFEAEIDYEVFQDSKTLDVDIEVKINEGRSGRIKEVVFKNFTKSEEKDLLEMIHSKKYNILTSWATEKGTYLEEAAERDSLIITEYLHNKGYADAHVNIYLEEVSEKNRVNLVISVDKGEKYSISTVSFEGNTLFDDELIQKLIVVKDGETYSPEKLRKAVQNISDAYGIKGYIDTFVNFTPKLNPNAKEFAIHFRIEEGEKYRVGLIKVFGNHCTETRVILHETLLTPGAVFNSVRLKQTEQRLKNIGYFENVNVYAVRSCAGEGLSDGYRDIHIEVEETTTGNFGAFFALSTSESIVGGLNVTESNFNLKGITHIGEEGLGALRGGGEFFSPHLSIGKKHYTAGVSWTKPYFCDTPWIIGFDVSRASNRTHSEHSRIRSNNLTFFAKYPVNPFLKLGLHYRLVDSDVKLSGTTSTLDNDAMIDGIVSAAGVSLYYDSTNDLISPSRGLRSRLETEIAGLGGEHFFLGLGYTNTFYHAITCNGVFKLRADTRFLVPFNGSGSFTLPMNERFFLGGDTTVRGYRTSIIGPLDEVAYAPRGGISMALVSAEYSHCFHPRVSGFTFFDGGTVNENKFNLSHPRYSVGYGVRLRVYQDAPPLTIGMGYPINPKNRESDVKKFFLSMSGRF